MKVLSKLAYIHAVFCSFAEKLCSPLLLAIRLYWGWQLVQTGLGKLRNQERVVEFFTSLNIPFPAINAHFVSGLEFFGGMLLIIGFLARPISLMLTFSMLVAYWTASRDALLAIFSDPGKFYAADPFTFLFAAILIFAFGPGLFSLDYLLQHRSTVALQTRRDISMA
jgi:putative oxidoreductase